MPCISVEGSGLNLQNLPQADVYAGGKEGREGHYPQYQIPREFWGEEAAARGCQDARGCKGHGSMCRFPLRECRQDYILAVLFSFLLHAAYSMAQVMKTGGML